MKVGLKPIPNGAQSLAAHCANVGPPAQHCGAVTWHALHPHLLALPLVPQGYGEVLHSNYRPPAIVLKD